MMYCGAHSDNEGQWIGADKILWDEETGRPLVFVAYHSMSKKLIIFPNFCVYLGHGNPKPAEYMLLNIPEITGGVKPIVEIIIPPMLKPVVEPVLKKWQGLEALTDFARGTYPYAWRPKVDILPKEGAKNPKWS